MSLAAHYVFGTTSALSHSSPVCNLALALLTATPDLCVSMILHNSFIDHCASLCRHADASVRDRLKFFPVGEEREEINKHYMTMVYESGEVYAKILMDRERPAPTVFIFDMTSFFYVQVKAAVEAKFAHLKPTRTMAYYPQAASEAVFLFGDEKNGSLRWVDAALDKEAPEARVDKSTNALMSDKGGESDIQKLLPPEEKHRRMVMAYRKCVTENDRLVNIAGYPPLHLYERWSADIPLSEPHEFGWFTFLAGIQSVAPVPEAWISCFPSSVFEPETLDLVRRDSVISAGGTKEYLEAGWFEVGPAKDMGDGVKAFLDKHGEKQVVYISFGTLYDPGQGLMVLLEFLEHSKQPYVYACGSQKHTLSEETRNCLHRAETEGRCIAPDWVDQIGLLNHPAVLCFISHCGVNSTIEAILATVPLVTWGRRSDQITLSTQVGAKGLGFEILQHRSGYSVGKPIAHRPDCVLAGTPEALRDELESVMKDVRGPKGEVVRGNMSKMANEIREKRKGQWAKTVEAFGRWGRE